MKEAGSANDPWAINDSEITPFHFGVKYSSLLGPFLAPVPSVRTWPWASPWASHTTYFQDPPPQSGFSYFLIVTLDPSYSRSEEAPKIREMVKILLCSVQKVFRRYCEICAQELFWDWRSVNASRSFWLFYSPSEGRSAAPCPALDCRTGSTIFYCFKAPN